MLIALCQCLLLGQSERQELDQIIKLDGKISVSSESERWLKITVPFVIVEHPDLKKMEGKRPETIEEMFNPEFLNDLKINIWISFMNEFKRKELRGERQDVQYFDYYSAEIECLSLEIDRKTKRAEFLIPAMVAKMNDCEIIQNLLDMLLNFPVTEKVFMQPIKLSFSIMIKRST